MDEINNLVFNDFIFMVFCCFFVGNSFLFCKAEIMHAFRSDFYLFINKI